MKVLFLDMDGVVNNLSSMVHYNAHLWPPLVCKLNQISNSDTDVKIVISSAWRIIFTMDEIKTMLYKTGWTYAHNIIDMTPTINDAGFTRGDEIQAWLDKQPAVTHYAIIDDDSDMLEHQEPHFVKTLYELGITDDSVDKIKEILEL